MKNICQCLLTVPAFLVFVIGGKASAEGSGIDSTKAYELIVQNRSDAEVRSAVTMLSERYQNDLAAGRISSETDRELVLEAIPVIIDRMDETDKKWAITVFYVLASLQTDCPAPKKEYWQEWWKRKQKGEEIRWAIHFTSDSKVRARSGMPD